MNIFFEQVYLSEHFHVKLPNKSNPNYRIKGFLLTFVEANSLIYGRL